MPRGQVTEAVGRRAALRTIGGAGAAVLGVACASRTSSDAESSQATLLSCIATPEGVEGPFYVDERMNRSNLVGDTREPFVTAGIPLVLRLGVFAVGERSCAPLEGARIDLWHASAEGVYSDEPSSLLQKKRTVGETYLRGYQLSDRTGRVEFTTIYPGWYANRTIHVHVKVTTEDRAGKRLEWTTQLYLANAINDVVSSSGAYATRGLRKIARNEDDALYAIDGRDLTIDVRPTPGGGYAGTYDIGLRL